MFEPVLYRVVGIRDDGKRLVLVTHIALDRAQSLVESLDGIAAFRETAIEPQPVSSDEIEIPHGSGRHRASAV